jgi:hypothetical protein
MKGTDLKNRGGYQDWASLHTWYQEDPLKNHMKLQTFFGMQGKNKYQYSITNELLANKAVLDVNGWEGKFSYDLPVETIDEMTTVADMSSQEYAGIDETTFKIVLNEELSPGTTFTADAYRGMELVVSESEPVRAKSDGYEHTVVLNTKDPDATYPSQLLAKGIQYFVTGHGVAEFGTKFAKVRMPESAGYMTCEFQLGSVRGAESFVTGKADSVNLGGGIAQSKDYMEEIMSQSNNIGELMVMMDMDKAGNPIRKTGRVGSVMEFLTLRELDRLTATSHMFQKSGVIKGANGTIRYNEGLWPQLRRGYVKKYGRKGGITKEHIKDMADYVYRANTDLPVIERKLKIKAGTPAYNNVMEIFDKEAKLQLQLTSSLLGTDRILPTSPVSGDLYNLSLKVIRFKEVFLPGIGYVEISEDTSLNRMGLSDRRISGMHQQGYDHTAFSLIIWDAEDQQYSNNKSMPKGTTLIEGGNSGANVYMVKPEGSYVHFGRRTGRYDSRTATDIMSSFKEMGEEFFAYNNSAIWLADPSRFVMLELDEPTSKGFN